MRGVKESASELQNRLFKNLAYGFQSKLALSGK
jgi:hypothetical protein